MPGSDIFLSYASEDRDRILPVVTALESTGWTVFWDRTIPPGKTWRQVVGKELDGCRSVVVVWSRASVESDWALEEAEEGQRREVLVPVRIDAVKPPLGFRSTQYLDLVGWDGSRSARSFETLVKALGSLLGKPRLAGAHRAPVPEAAMGRLWGEMQLSRRAYDSQHARCQELREAVTKRLGVAEDLSFEGFLFRYYEKMIPEELFVFQKIRVVTEGTLAPGNQRMLGILRAHPELADEVPCLAALRQHLESWMSKYETIFRNTPGMAVCYAEDVGWPPEVEGAVRAWIDIHEP